MQKLKGKASFVAPGESGGDCQYKECQLSSPEIIQGYIKVVVGKNTYHANCAKQLDIDFEVPHHKRIPRGKNA